MQDDKNEERRRESRFPAAGKVLFFVNKRAYEGRLKNVSLSGVCIRRRIFLYSGNRVTVALPGDEETRSGEVIWSNGKSFGLQFEN